MKITTLGVVPFLRDGNVTGEVRIPFGSTDWKPVFQSEGVGG